MSSGVSAGPGSAGSAISGSRSPGTRAAGSSRRGPSGRGLRADRDHRGDRGGRSGIGGVSRDEVKSGDLDERWGACLPQLRCQLGDVRDAERMEELFRGCDVVVHAAALKRVGHSVYSPGEVLKTNVLGTMAVVRAATEVGVGRVVVVSSDKAVEPTNLYGVSKAAAETYAVQANSYSLPRGTRVSCVRYGNVLGSRGAVPHVWRAPRARGAAPA